MKFVRFNRRNEVHTADGDECLICNKKTRDGVVVFVSRLVGGPLVYCASCIRRLGGALETEKP